MIEDISALIEELHKLLQSKAQYEFDRHYFGVVSEPNLQSMGDHLTSELTRFIDERINPQYPQLINGLNPIITVTMVDKTLIYVGNDDLNQFINKARLLKEGEA